ncbi:MAG TPA: cobyric acid synthase [Rectinemataceae bacterium]|nr:cobyric acid synthase [Rectinemataceae bacterium]
MAAKAIMVQGTASSVGKSLIAAALCRIFARSGLLVMPFKAQNMSNNAAALPDGSEIGRAQYLQALAAGVEPRVEMNPILLKPESDSRSQVILMGKPYETLGAVHYYERKAPLWKSVVGACATLSAEADLLVIEGAGSPAEINLASSDIVNMAVARHLGSPVILVADIDPGGVFAQVVGTLALLSDEDRALVRGIVINKFRGDISLLEPGLGMLERLTGLPVLGVVPMLTGLALPDEDGASIRVRGAAGRASGRDAGGIGGPSDDAAGAATLLDIAVIKLPHIANFDDFDALASEPSVALRFVEDAGDLGRPDVIILPGTKSTMADLSWLKSRGFDDGIRWLARTGSAVVGICGGFQMLGESIEDPERVEGQGGSAKGLGLLRASTVFEADKKVSPRRGHTAAGLGGRLASLAGIAIEGYEIHSGETKVDGPAFALLEPDGREGSGEAANKARVMPDSQTAATADGAWSPDGAVWGTYLHDIFSSDEFRKAWLAGFGAAARRESRKAELDASIEALADAVEASLDMDRLREIIGISCIQPIGKGVRI